MTAHAAPCCFDRPAAAKEEEQQQQEQLSSMLEMERRYHGALNSTSRMTAPPLPPCVGWRSRICDWYFKVADKWNFDREAACVALNLFDRYLIALEERRQGQRQPYQQDDMESDEEDECDQSAGIDSRTYQLAATACLYVSIKLRSPLEDDEDDKDDDSGSLRSPPSPSSVASLDEQFSQHPQLRQQHRRSRLGIKTFAALSRGQFTVQDIAAAELDVLQALKWQVQPPPAAEFAGRFLGLMPLAPRDDVVDAPPRSQQRRRVQQRRRDRVSITSHVLYELSRYLVELSACVPELAALPPSSIAYSALSVSMDLLNQECLPPVTRHSFHSTAARLSHGRLYRGSEEAIWIEETMRENFLPEMLLFISEDTGCSQEQGPFHRRHPLAVARDLGLLRPDLLAPPMRMPSPPVHGGHGGSSSSASSTEYFSNDYCGKHVDQQPERSERCSNPQQTMPAASPVTAEQIYSRAA